MNEALSGIYQAARSGDFRRAAELLEEGLKENPDLAGANRVGFAHLLILGGRWGLVSKLLPAGTNFFLESGWLNSLATGKPVNKTGDPVPWFTYPAIDYLEPRLNPGWKVLEYGSGQSTLWWAGRVAGVHAVEHDEQWYNSVRENLPGNATVELRSAQDDYVGTIASSPMAPFDVAVIDGEFRNACARFVAPYVNDDGIIVFDNSDRIMFRDGIEYLSENGWKRIDFFGLTPSYSYKSCTSVFYRTDSWMRSAPTPCDQVLSTGATCSQAIGE